MGPLLRSCAKVDETMELSFEVVSGVGRGMGVLEGVHVPQRDGGVSEILFPIALGCIFKPKAQNIQTLLGSNQICVAVKTTKYSLWVVQ